MNVSSHTTCSRDIWTSCFDWVQPDPEAACMHACMQQASVLFASAGLNLKGGDTCFSIHDQHQFMCIFLGRGSGGWEKSVKWDIIELFASSVCRWKWKKTQHVTEDRGCLVFSASCIHLMHLAELLCGREACLPLCDSQAVQQGERVASLDEGRIPCLMAFFQVICSPDLPLQATEVCFPPGWAENGWREHFLYVCPQLTALIWRVFSWKGNTPIPQI